MQDVPPVGFILFIYLFIYMVETTQRIKTGIDGLDKLLGGGLESKNSYLVSGESGTGKTVLCMQFIYSGLQRGENAIYVAVHETPQEVIDDAKSFGWDMTEYIKNKHMIILNMAPYVAKVDKDEVFSVDKLIDDLTEQVKKINAKLIVLDAVDFIARHSTKSDRDLGEYIRKIILAVGVELGCTTVLTSNIKPGEKNLSQSGMEERIVTGIILLETDQNGTRRTMQIKKMRQTEVDLSRVSYRIDATKGIVITSR